MWLLITVLDFLHEDLLILMFTELLPFNMKVCVQCWSIFIISAYTYINLQKFSLLNIYTLKTHLLYMYNYWLVFVKFFSFYLNFSPFSASKALIYINSKLSFIKPPGEFLIYNVNLPPPLLFLTHNPQQRSIQMVSPKTDPCKSDWSLFH